VYVSFESEIDGGFGATLMSAMGSLAAIIESGQWMFS